MKTSSSPDAILRAPEDAAQEVYDLVVIGGGVYGIALTLESARRGLKVLLLEKEDFGAHTSWHSLRIVHGGLRYLQHLDLGRFRASVEERHWFMRSFPELVHPLPCLMPLYGEGLKRPLTFGAALKLNDFLSRRRNAGLEAGARLPGGQVLNAAETAARFPQVPAEGLRGGGAWHDARMLSSERVLIEMLRWACGAGARALNYCAADGVETDKRRITGVRAADALTGRQWVFKCRRAVNCAGPFCETLANKLDRAPTDFFLPSLAYNLLLDHPPPAASAVAVSPRRPDAPAYFLVPWRGKLLAGTRHLPFAGDPEKPHPGAVEIGRFLAELNACVPGADYRPEQVLRVQAGVLPARQRGGADTAKHPVWADHGREGGLAGLYSVSGVKFTTARHVAEETLRRIFGKQTPPAGPQTGRPAAARERARFLTGPGEDLPGFAALAAEESAVHLSDLLLRRCDWIGDRAETLRTGRALCEQLGWDEARTERELAALAETLRALSPDPDLNREEMP